MQLKLKRTQRDSGVMSKSVVFCLDARADYSPEERQSIQRYKLHKQVVYNSEASKKHLASYQGKADSSGWGGFSGMASLAMAAMNLNITVESLEKGQHIECKSMQELLSAENELMEACEDLKNFLTTALTFDGREVVINFDSETPQVVAQAAPAQVTQQPAAAVQQAIPERREEAPQLQAPEPRRPYEIPDDSFFPRHPRKKEQGAWDKYVSFVGSKLPRGYEDNAQLAAVALSAVGLVFLWWLWITIT